MLLLIIAIITYSNFTYSFLSHDFLIFYLGKYIELNSHLIYIKSIFHFALLIFLFLALILVKRFNMGFDNCWCYSIFLWFGFTVFVWLWNFCLFCINMSIY